MTVLPSGWQAIPHTTSQRGHRAQLFTSTTTNDDLRPSCSFSTAAGQV